MQDFTKTHIPGAWTYKYVEERQSKLCNKNGIWLPAQICDCLCMFVFVYLMSWKMFSSPMLFSNISLSFLFVLPCSVDWVLGNLCFNYKHILILWSMHNRFVYLHLYMYIHTAYLSPHPVVTGVFVLCILYAVLKLQS